MKHTSFDIVFATCWVALGLWFCYTGIFTDEPTWMRVADLIIGPIFIFADGLKLHEAWKERQ